MTTAQERAELRKLADAAKGWSNIVEIRPVTEDDPCTVDGGEFYPVMTIQCEDYYVESLPLAKHIAAANPAKTLELLDDIERLTAERDLYEADAERLKAAGSPMANTMFNLAQTDDKHADSFKQMQISWDAAMKGQS